MYKAFNFGRLFFFMSLCPGLIHAGITNDLPSCYEANKLSFSANQQVELFVLFDQTTILDSRLQNIIRENLGRLLIPGTSFVMANFSSYNQGHYVEVTTAGSLESLLTDRERGDIGRKTLRSFDECMKGQFEYGRKVAGITLNKAFSSDNPDLVRSDIMASLKELSSRVKHSNAKNKVVLIASDMLEHSSMTSFYNKRTVRLINPKAEINKASDNQLFGDFGGARVYVIGAGMLAEDAKHPGGVYRPHPTMQALLRFWSEYFKKSNAELVEFGQPALLNSIY